MVRYSVWGLKAKKSGKEAGPGFLLFFGDSVENHQDRGDFLARCWEFRGSISRLCFLVIEGNQVNGWQDAGEATVIVGSFTLFVFVEGASGIWLVVFV